MGKERKICAKFHLGNPASQYTGNKKINAFVFQLLFFPRCAVWVKTPSAPMLLQCTPMTATQWGAQFDEFNKILLADLSMLET